MVNRLIEDIDQRCERTVRLVLTENVPDAQPLKSLPGRAEKIINRHARGFGANHNAAFTRCRTPFFCVMNPDVRLLKDPFPELTTLLSDPEVGAVAPLIRNPTGSIEDSARHFPTLAALVCKLLSPPSGPDYGSDRGPVRVDWVAGMCIVLRSDAYQAVRGFDERYFLYYEDVDLCRRLHGAGFAVLYNPKAEVVHDARRGSRRDPRLALHHARSMLRYFTDSWRSNASS
jgi:GT2 family glycosyltransferase